MHVPHEIANKPLFRAFPVGLTFRSPVVDEDCRGAVLEQAWRRKLLVTTPSNIDMSFHREEVPDCIPESLMGFVVLP